jgi:hypothetical protein
MRWGQAAHARAALEEHRSSPDYLYKTGYKNDIDEQTCQVVASTDNISTEARR